MVLAAFTATGFLVAGTHAWYLLKDPAHVFHQRACTIALWVSVIPALLQPVRGDLLAQQVATYQPAKLAAFEAHFHKQAGSPFYLGGLPDSETQTVPYSLAISQRAQLAGASRPECGRDRTGSVPAGSVAAGFYRPCGVPADGRERLPAYGGRRVECLAVVAPSQAVSVTSISVGIGSGVTVGLSRH